MPIKSKGDLEQPKPVDNLDKNARKGHGGNENYVGSKKTLTKRSETQGSFTNLGSNPGAHNKTNFNSYPSGSGFSGAYDPKSGKFLAYPSGNTRLKDGSIPENLVDRMGGHKATNEALSGVLGEHTSNGVE